MKVLKKYLKRTLAMALTICNLISVGALGISAVASTDEVYIYGMTVNNFTAPIGIDTATPTFGWKLQSDTVGQKQTAYQLVIATDEALSQVIWDSGKVESDDTTDIAYAGDSLADCTRYYWQVTIWDMQGRAFASDVRFFETGFVNGSLTDGADWIALRETWDTEDEENAYEVNYAIEMDVYQLQGAIGVMLGSAKTTDTKSFMWQIQKKDTYFQVAPQYYDSTYKYLWRAATNTTFATSNAEYAALEQNGFHLRIWVTDQDIKTYIDGTLISTIQTADISGIPQLGLLGVRGATNETAEVDNVRVTDYVYDEAGAELVFFDFTDTIPSFTNSMSHIEDGRFIMKDPDGGTWFGEEYFATGLISEKPLSVNYTIEADIVDITGALAIVFGTKANTDGGALMWQVRDKGTYYQLAPQYYDSSVSWAWSEVSNNQARVDFGQDTYTTLQENGFRIKLYVSGDAVKTYIDDTLISTVTAAQLGYAPGLGFVGVRYGTNEGGTLENVKVTDYVTDAAGKVLYERSDAHTATGGTTYFTTGLVSVQEDTAAVHYTYEADVSLQSKAATLCFAMKDTNNFAMWQFVESGDNLLFRPQVRSNGVFSTLAEVDISDKLSLETLKAGVHLKIEVDEDTIDLYADGVLVNSFDSAAVTVDLLPRKFGTRIATDERFTLDNLKAVDYTDDPAGKVLFDHDCDKFNPLYRGQLKDGKIQMLSNTDTGVTMVHNGTTTFRKTFDVTDKQIASARLYITSYGLFSGYLNGKRVGNTNTDGEVIYDELTPGWTDQNYRTCYYTYDITDFLQSGENTLAVSVNDGWTGVALYNVNEPSRPHQLLAKAVITYTDGTTTQIGTDSTWRSARMGPVVSATIFQGEYYDANADTSYRLNGYDDTAWNAAKKVTFDTTLTSRIGGQIYVRKDLERVPKSVTVYDGVTDAVDGTQYGKISTVATYGDESFSLKAGETAIVDFGQNAAGWENITLTGAKGTEVVIRHAEMLNDNMGLISRGNDGPEGSIYTANLRNAPSRTLYVMCDGEQSYRPSATYYGFRYIEITASADITITKVRGEVVSSITEETGSFESSDALLNQLYSNIMWGQRSNYFGQATDCPQRDERLGYSGDAQVFSQTAMYNADVKAFMYNFMDTLVEGQAEDGAYGNTMPSKASSNDVWAGVAGFADAGIIVPHTYYKQYGDIAFLERYYPSMTKYMDYLAACGAERIGQKFGDWLAYEGNIINYISYVYTIWDAQMMQEIAQILGKTEDVAKWEAMEVTHKQYFRDKFLDENGDLVSDVTTQAGYLFALKLGLYESQEAWQRGKEALIAKIKNNGNKLSTGFMGTSVIMETLVEIGEKELAYELLFQEENPSWLFSVKQGATTVWERWNSYSLADGFGPVSMNSFNHYAYGSVGDYLYNTVLGIQAESAGYKTILLAPETTEKLTYARGSYDSANGKTESAWELGANGRYAYAFTVPMNTTATVKLEKQAYASNYYVNGVAAADATLENDGAAFLKEEDGYVYFEVVSGKFTFTCEAIPPLSAEKSSENGIFAFSVAGLSEYNGGYTANSNKNWYAFPAEDTGVVDAITGNFNMYYNREAVYLQRTDVTATNLDDADTYAGSTAGDSRWILLYDNYLQRKTSKTAGEKMRKIDSLVPVDSGGEEIVLTNFETTFDIRFESDTLGAALLGFRQQAPGKFADNVWTLNKNQAFVAIGRGGINIAGGNDIVSGNGATGDMYNTWQTAAFDELLPQEVSVKIKAVGTTCEVWIYNKNTENQIGDHYYKAEIPYEKAGTLAYGVSTVGHDIGDFKLTRLDENGDPADIFTEEATDISHLPYSHGNITVEDAEKTEAGYKYTVTVTPDAGYELRVGSLIVTDAAGNAYVPTRVGFRENGDATRYTVETVGGGTVYAKFVKPGKETPNIGNVGISINTELDGVRFVSRFTRVAEGDKEYVVLDGKKYEITDYGMLLGLATVIGDGELSTETAAANKYIKQLSVKDSGIYYDVCDGYIDMSVCIIGIDDVAGGADMKITARGYVKVIIDEQETVLYSAPFTASYNDFKEGAA